MRLSLTTLLLLSLCLGFAARAEEQAKPTATPEQQRVIQSLAAGEAYLGSLPLRDIIKATTGHSIIPFDPAKDAVSQRIAAAVANALQTTLAEANGPRSPLKQKRRINETSKWFEDRLQALLAATPGFACDFPRTAEGKAQRSGYPDLRLVHQASGRVAYLDPKVYEQSSETSSLRTFYYEPAGRTGKVLDDAHHLLLGIAHDGNTGHWTFLRWSIVDIGELSVRLKAEFHAGNKDIYRPGAIKAQGEMGR